MLNAYNVGKLVSAAEVIQFLKGAKSEDKCGHLNLTQVIKDLEESQSCFLSIKASQMPQGVKDLIQQGHKIEAIKMLYSSWNEHMNLSECKDVCERYGFSLKHLEKVKERNRREFGDLKELLKR